MEEKIFQERKSNIKLNFGDMTIYIVRDKKINFIQRKMWKILLGIDIKNV